MTAWVVRAGANGENEDWNLQMGRAGVGWSEIGDMSGCASREDVRAIVDRTYPLDPAGRRANSTGQLWAIRRGIVPGDLVIMPLKRTGRLAFGICSAGYSYDAEQPDKTRRHHISVDWREDHLSRSGFKDDLLNSINGALTVFSLSRNNAEARLGVALRTGIDPGSDGVSTAPVAAPEQTTTGDEKEEMEESGVVDPAPAPTMDVIRDRIRTHLVENFSGHKLAALIGDILAVQGFVCEVSPEGADGGVDILAGRGPLGLDSPTLVVEVKSESTAVGARIVRGLQGAITNNQADQGLLVAWGGITPSVKREFSQQRTRMRIWDAEDILDQLFNVYPELPASTRAQLPLKMTWILDEEPGS